MIESPASAYQPLPPQPDPGLSLKQFVELDALVNIAAYDTGITLWDNKIEYDSVRPSTAIRYLNEQGKLTGGKKTIKIQSIRSPAGTGSHTSKPQTTPNIPPARQDLQPPTPGRPGAI